MTRRFGRSYDWIFKFLVLRDGEKCYLCGKKFDDHGRKELIIEHKDNDEKNFRDENLGLAHRSCNTRKNPPNVSVSLHDDRGTFPQGEIPQSETPTPKLEDAYSNQVAFKKQPNFRRYIFVRVKIELQKGTSRSLESLVTDAAEACMISTSTSYKWMSKLTSDSGPFRNPATTTPPGQIIFKEPGFPLLSERELEELFPCNEPTSDTRKEELKDKARQLWEEQGVIEAEEAFKGR